MAEPRLDIGAQRRNALAPLVFRTVADDDRTAVYREEELSHGAPLAVVTVTRVQPAGFDATVRRGQKAVAAFQHRPTNPAAWPPNARTVTVLARQAILPDTGVASP